MGHSNTLLNHLERFGLTHLSQAAMVSITVLSLAAFSLSASQALLRDNKDTFGTTSPSQHLPAPDLNLVSQAQLFGAGSASTTTASDGLPSTRLQWVLQGIFTGSTAQNGSAIILAGDQSAMLYKAQQPMPGGALLSEVHKDHVVIDIDGRRETLRFPTISSLPNLEAVPAVEAEPVLNIAGDSISSRREIIRQRLEMLRQRALSR